MQLPTSLAIGLWFTGSIWFVAILAYVFEQPGEIVVGVFVLGLVAAVAEWSLRRKPEDPK